MVLFHTLSLLSVGWSISRFRSASIGLIRRFPPSQYCTIRWLTFSRTATLAGPVVAVDDGTELFWDHTTTYFYFPAVIVPSMGSPGWIAQAREEGSASSIRWQQGTSRRRDWRLIRRAVCCLMNECIVCQNAVSTEASSGLQTHGISPDNLSGPELDCEYLRVAGVAEAV